MRGIDSLLAEILDRRRTEQVAPNPRHHEYFRAAETRRHGLVRSLAAKAEIEFLPENRFPRLGKPVVERGQINIRAANYRDARPLCHSESLGEAGRVY